MSFFKYVVGFLALNEANNILDDFANKINNNNNNRYRNGRLLSDHDAWLDSQGLLNDDGSTNRKAVREYLDGPIEPVVYKERLDRAPDPSWRR